MNEVEHIVRAPLSEGRGTDSVGAPLSEERCTDSERPPVPHGEERLLLETAREEAQNGSAGETVTET